MKRDVVVLPATEPSDRSFGEVPKNLDTGFQVSIRDVQFPRMVWYNHRIRSEAIVQIRSLGVAPLVLVGFSKSGLGAWNIARAIPDLISATVIFDAPVMRTSLPPWGTAPYYADAASWRKDLPANTIPAFQSAMPKTHRLVLISGERFHKEMRLFSRELDSHGLAHIFIPRPRLRHRWDSGWLEIALNQTVDTR